MYYKPKVNEYVKWESLDNLGSVFQYEIKIATVSNHHIPFLIIFKLYESLFSEIVEATQMKNKFHLASFNGVKEYDYETRIIRGKTQRELIDIVRSGNFSYIVKED